jgi:hypothetical protein
MYSGILEPVRRFYEYFMGFDSIFILLFLLFRLQLTLKNNK